MNCSALSARAEILGPGPAFGEKLEPQHVHHAHGRQACAEKFRALRHNRAYQQPAVAASLDGEFIGPRVFIIDEPLGRGDEIVENVLLIAVLCPPGARPRRIRRPRGDSAWA